MAEINDSAAPDECSTPTGFSTPLEKFTASVDPNVLSTKPLVDNTQSQHAAEIGKESDISEEQEKHLMISYSWKYQETSLKINDRLKKLGYKIWIDTEQMSGSTLKCMAEAVENSEIALMCLSRAYKESENCQIEGEYICSKKIPFIPLLVESGYKADGWLGALLGTKLYIDFSQPENFETKLAELVTAIDRKLLTHKRNWKPTVTSLNERARQLLKASKFSEVISLLEDLPPSKDQQMMLAECYFKTEVWDKAKNALETLKTIEASKPHVTPSGHIEDTEAPQAQRFEKSSSPEPETSSKPIFTEQQETTPSRNGTSVTAKQTGAKKKKQGKKINCDGEVKIVFIGDGAVGKSCLLVRFLTGQYPDVYDPTVFDTYAAKIEIDGEMVDVSMWDTAGQEDYDELRTLSYPDTDVVLIFFSMDSIDSFRNVPLKWFQAVQQYMKNVPIILVGNKKDLRNDAGTLRMLQRGNQKPPEIADGESIAKKIGAKHYLECSARTNDGVQEVIEQAVRAGLAARAKIRKRKSKTKCPIS